MSNYFIKVYDAKDTRRKLLESSKASIHILKGFQRLQKTRGEKLSLIKHFRHELKEITVLVNRLDELLPQFTEQELKNMKEAAALPALGNLPKGRKKKSSYAGKHVFIGQPEKRKRVTKKEQIEHKKAYLKEEELSDLDKLEHKLRNVENRLGRL